MVKDERIMSKSIRWKVSIMPQWNALAFQGILGFHEYSHEQLRRRYKYLQSQLSILPSSTSNVVGDIYQEITEGVNTQAEVEIMANSSTSLPFIDTNSLQVSRSESTYEPQLCNQLPSLQEIHSAIVQSTTKGTPYS